MGNLLILMLVCLAPPEEFNYMTQPSLILTFAESLEQEGDYYRAISEYKRFLYFSNDTSKCDTVIYRIARVYGKLGKFGNARDILSNISMKAKRYNLECGKLYFLASDYEKAREFWSANETLIGWTYLRECKFTEASQYLGDIGKPVLKSLLLGGMFSTLIPGLGRIYADRTGDGIYSFLFTVGSGFLAYKYYERDETIPAAIFGSLTLFFWLGDIYGAVISVELYNDRKKGEFIRGVEMQLNLRL